MATSPNIILILTDQHRLSALGCAGETPCLTPNLDRLAAEGVRFETAYTVCPVCSPARATIMTGKYPHQHGICANIEDLGASVHELPDSPRLLSRRLRQAGYRCGYTGKWHLGTGAGNAWGTGVEPTLPRDVGFEGQNFPGHGGGGFGYPEYKEYLAQNGFKHEPRRLEGVSYATDCYGIISGVLSGPVEATVPHFLADHTIGLIDRFHGGNEPFFVWHNFWGPHGPFYAPPEFFEMYRDAKIPEWPNYRWDGVDSNGPHQAKLHPKRDALTWDDWADAVRHYYAFMTLIDLQIGRIIEHLRKTGLLENTVVLFAADHGETLGSHGGLTDKGWHHFEETHRIPFIVRPPDAWSDALRGRVRTEFASLADVYPTVVDLAGQEVGAGAHGLSLRPLLRDGVAPRWRDTAVVEFNGVNSLATSMVTLRCGSIKYGWNCSSWDELYDLDADPWEMRNLARDPAHADTLREMRLALKAWMDETGYPGRRLYEHSRLE